MTYNRQYGELDAIEFDEDELDRRFHSRKYRYTLMELRTVWSYTNKKNTDKKILMDGIKHDLQNYFVNKQINHKQIHKVKFNDVLNELVYVPENSFNDSPNEQPDNKLAFELYINLLVENKVQASLFNTMANMGDIQTKIISKVAELENTLTFPFMDEWGYLLFSSRKNNVKLSKIILEKLRIQLFEILGSTYFQINRKTVDGVIYFTINWSSLYK